MVQSVVNKSSKRASIGAVILIAVTTLGLASCQNKPKQEAPRLDVAAENMPFARPVLVPLVSLSGVPPLPPAVSNTLDLRRAFFAGDFSYLDTALNKARDEFINGSGNVSMADTFVEDIEDTNLAGIDVCADWLKAMPNSYPAHWVCGAMWENGAQVARVGEYAEKVGAARFALMYERQARSNALLERALTLTDKPFEALTILAINQYLVDSKKQAEDYLQRAEQFKPQYLPIHKTRMNYTLPEWGGTPEALQAAMKRAKQAGLSESALLDLEDSYIVRPSKMTNPGAARAYWERAISKHPTRKRLSRLMNDFIWLENWQGALPVVNRLIDTYPEYIEAYYQRARIIEKMGHIPEARVDYQMAAAMGHNLALQALIMAHIRGGLGLPGKSFAEVDELCRYGASLGSSVGANCLGSLFFEGGSHGVPSSKLNVSQAFAWHLVGARAGHYNSQYDLGWMIFTGRGPGVSPDAAKRIGTFWLRRAAEQNHVFAKRKLEEAGISLTEEIPQSRNLSVDSIRLTLHVLLDLMLEKIRLVTEAI